MYQTSMHVSSSLHQTSANESNAYNLLLLCFLSSYDFHFSHSVIFRITNDISYQRSSNKNPFISKPDQRILEYNCNA